MPPRLQPHRVNDSQRPRFAKGVKLRRDGDDAMLLVPEGALVLNGSASVALELVDGIRTLQQIVAELVERFDVSPELARAETAALFERLIERGFLRAENFPKEDAP